MLILLLAACGGSEVQQVNTPSLVPLTPVIRATLPPAWTATFTHTPSLTPTLTITPTRTPTFTVTPTLAAAQICEQFTLTSAPEPGVSIAYNGVIGFSWAGAPPDSIIVLSLIDHLGEETSVAFPQNTGINALFNLNALNAWGAYEWRLSVVLQSYGEICTQNGAFQREPWWVKPFDNPLAPPFAN